MLAGNLVRRQEGPAARPGRHEHRVRGDDEQATPVRDQIPTYGMAAPEPGEHPSGTKERNVQPLQYKLPDGQVYAVGDSTEARDYNVVYGRLNDPNNHEVAVGDETYETYVPISYNHRWVYVKESALKTA